MNRSTSDRKGLSTHDEYGFYDRLSATFPSQIIVDASEICNLACTHCPHPQFKESEYYSASTLPPDLNRKMVDEVRQYGQGHTRYIRYTSEGEPLTNSKIYEMLEYATRESGVSVALTTNGTLINEDRCERLLSIGLALIDISIDAYRAETYAKIRVNGNLDLTRANVLRLIDRAQQQQCDTKIVVSYVEQPANQQETKDFESFWTQAGASRVVVRRLHSAAGANSEISSQIWAKQNSQERYPCLYPWERIVLNPRGYLAFCPADWTHGSSIIDYRKTTIQETWRSAFYDSLRQAHICNKFENHSFCGKCPDWSLTRWPGQGRSYADMVEEFKATE